MPLPLCISEDKVLEVEIKEEPLTSAKIISLVRKVLSKRDWDLQSKTYVLDISLHNRQDPDEPLDTSSLYDNSTIGDDESDDTIAIPRESSNLIDFRRYEIAFNDEGRASLKNFSHKPKAYDGEITNVVLQIAEKPKITFKGLSIPIKHYKFNDEEGEHEIHLSLKDIYQKAVQELSNNGFPRIRTNQNVRLRLAFYFMDELIARKSVLWNPMRATLANNSDGDNTNLERMDADEFDMDEYIALLPDRPDHVRLQDVRLESVSLFWLQEWINKVLDERLGRVN
jgi:hypothetical protein